MGSLQQDAAWDCYPGVCDQGQSLLLKIEIQFPLNNFSLLWLIDTKLAVWVLLLKIEIQFPLNNFSLFWPIDTKLGACN